MTTQVWTQLLSRNVLDYLSGLADGAQSTQVEGVQGRCSVQQRAREKRRAQDSSVIKHDSQLLLIGSFSSKLTPNGISSSLLKLCTGYYIFHMMNTSIASVSTVAASQQGYAKITEKKLRKYQFWQRNDIRIRNDVVSCSPQPPERARFSRI